MLVWMPISLPRPDRSTDDFVFFCFSEEIGRFFVIAVPCTDPPNPLSCYIHSSSVRCDCESDCDCPLIAIDWEIILIFYFLSVAFWHHFLPRSTITSHHIAFAVASALDRETAGRSRHRQRVQGSTQNVPDLAGSCDPFPPLS